MKKKMKALLLPMLFLIFSCDTPEEPDCAGISGGDAVEDCAGVCGGTMVDVNIDGFCDDWVDLTVTDVDGNTYETVQIGDQLWMAENLKVTHYNNGDEIPTGYSDEEWTELEDGAYAVYGDDPSNADTYGNLYNWFVADDDRGLCMDGWHIPSDEELKELEVYLGMCEGSVGGGYSWVSDGCVDNAGWRGTDEGSKLAGNSDSWNSGDLENNSEFGTSGFNILPTGYRNSLYGNYNNMDYYGYFWSSSKYGSYEAWYRVLNYNYSHVTRYYYPKQYGFSIRCLKD